MIARGVGVLCATIAARRVGGWSGFLLRTLLGYGFGSFIFAAGTATCSGYGASRGGWRPGPELAVDEASLTRGLLVELARGYSERCLGPLVQGALAANVAAGRLYGGHIDVPVLIQDIVAGQKLDKLTGGRTR